STLAQVSDAAAALGYVLSGEDLGKVYDAVQRVSKKKSVGARELEAVIATSAMQVPSTYHVESYMSTCTNGSNAMAQITLICGDEKLTGVAAGDGPIDSAFLAIEQIVGHNYELDAFEIQAVTEGKEALGSALVRLRSNGRLYSGNGLSTDIVGASIRAYVNALNKIVYEEKQS
ncbi:MAG: 2-isopropylmalate synthase, partial [Clostridia bacterium]|nr:2-isopropylmalate synthase [Clostridia bacterium]